MTDQMFLMIAVSCIFLMGCVMFLMLVGIASITLSVNKDMLKYFTEALTRIKTLEGSAEKMLAEISLLREQEIYNQTATNTSFQLPKGSVLGDLFQSGAGSPMTIFRSADGKYTGSTLPELIQNILGDPNNDYSAEEKEMMQRFLDTLNKIDPDEDI